MLATDIYQRWSGSRISRWVRWSADPAVARGVGLRRRQLMQRRQSASSPRAPYLIAKARRHDRSRDAGGLFADRVTILVILGVSFFASIATFWPYNPTPSFKNFDFDMMDGGGWRSYSTRSSWPASPLFGTPVIFAGAYLVEKTPRFRNVRGFVQFLAPLPSSVPGWCSASATSSSSTTRPIRLSSSTAQWPSRHLHDLAFLLRLAPDRGDALKQIDRDSRSFRHRSEFVLAYLHASDPAGLPASRAGYRHVSVREHDNNSLGGRLHLRAAHHACSHRRAQYG